MRQFHNNRYIEINVIDFYYQSVEVDTKLVVVVNAIDFTNFKDGLLHFK